MSPRCPSNDESFTVPTQLSTQYLEPQCVKGMSGSQLMTSWTRKNVVRAKTDNEYEKFRRWPKVTARLLANGRTYPHKDGCYRNIMNNININYKEFSSIRHHRNQLELQPFVSHAPVSGVGGSRRAPSGSVVSSTCLPWVLAAPPTSGYPTQSIVERKLIFRYCLCSSRDWRNTGRTKSR